MDLSISHLIISSAQPHSSESPESLILHSQDLFHVLKAQLSSGRIVFYPGVHYKSRKNNILDFAGYETYRDALFTELSELMSSSKGPSQIEHKPKRSGPCRSCPHPLLLHTSLLPAAPHQSAVHQLLINFSRNFCNMFVCLLSFHFEAKPIENLGPNTPASSLQV